MIGYALGDAAANVVAPQRGRLAVFDLDGTISDHAGRLHLIENKPRRWDEFWSECSNDLPIPSTIALAESLVAEGCRVEIWTGRSEVVRSETIEWLAQHNVPYHRMLMRPLDNYLPANELKGGWLEGLEDRPFLAIDDRQGCVEWWESQGVECLQVRGE